MKKVIFSVAAVLLMGAASVGCSDGSGNNTETCEFKGKRCSQDKRAVESCIDGDLKKQECKENQECGISSLGIAACLDKKPAPGPNPEPECKFQGDDCDKDRKKVINCTSGKLSEVKACKAEELCGKKDGKLDCYPKGDINIEECTYTGKKCSEDGLSVLECKDGKESSVKCEGNLKCVADGGDFVCKSEAPVGECTDGAVKCDDNDAKVNYLCEKGSWKKAPDCAVGKACYEGKCSDEKCPANFKPECDANFLVSCKGGALERTNCDAVKKGYECRISEGAAQCLPPVGKVCSAGTPDSCTSDKSARVVCEKGELTEIPCGTGEVCMVNAKDKTKTVCEASCVLDGKSKSCDGAKLKYCDPKTLRPAELDCKALMGDQASCGGTADNFGCFAGACTEKGKSFCKGNTRVMCNGKEYEGSHCDLCKEINGVAECLIEVEPEVCKSDGLQCIKLKNIGVVMIECISDNGKKYVTLRRNGACSADGKTRLVCKEADKAPVQHNCTEGDVCNHNDAYNYGLCGKKGCGDLKEGASRCTEDGKIQSCKQGLLSTSPCKEGSVCSVEKGISDVDGDVVECRNVCDPKTFVSKTSKEISINNRSFNSVSVCVKKSEGVFYESIRLSACNGDKLLKPGAKIGDAVQETVCADGCYEDVDNLFAVCKSNCEKSECDGDKVKSCRYLDRKKGIKVLTEAVDGQVCDIQGKASCKDGKLTVDPCAPTELCDLNKNKPVCMPTCDNIGEVRCEGKKMIECVRPGVLYSEECSGGCKKIDNRIAYCQDKCTAEKEGDSMSNNVMIINNEYYWTICTKSGSEYLTELKKCRPKDQAHLYGEKDEQGKTNIYYNSCKIAGGVCDEESAKCVYPLCVGLDYCSSDGKSIHGCFKRVGVTGQMYGTCKDLMGKDSCVKDEDGNVDCK